jgi:FtsH-binding integral membrane protein
MLLLAHILMGTGALLLGPVAMLARKARGWHTRAGEIYHTLVLGVCVTAVALAILGWDRSAAFLPIAIGSYAFALVGYVTAKLRFSGWLRIHVVGQGGSYIAMTTALLVVNLGRESFWAWALPTLVGTPLIVWAIRRISRFSGTTPAAAPGPGARGTL